MKLNKILVTALALTAITASAMAAPAVNQNDAKTVKDAMARWELMAQDGNTVDPIRQAKKFYIPGNMRITYYDELCADSSLQKQGFINVGVPMYVQERATGEHPAKNLSLWK